MRNGIPPELRGSRPRQLFVRNERRFPARVPAPAGPRRADLYSDASTLHLVDSLDGCGYSAPGGCWPAAGCAAVDAWGFVFNASAGPPLAYEDLPGVDVLSFGSWTAAWAPVARVVAENATLITAAPLANAPPGADGGPCTSGGRYVLHNVAEALAAGSGASYFSDAENAVYYAPLPSEAAAGLALEAVVPVLPTVLSVVGDDCGGPLSFIAFEGLNISHSTEGEPRPGSYQAAHGAVRLSSAAHVRLHNVSVSHAGGQGVLLDGALVEVALDAVDVRDTGGDGVGDSGATGDNVGTSITNCIVESTGHIFLAQPGGIRVTGSAAGTVTVAHNLVRDTSYSGIALGWTQGAARPPPGPVSSYQFVVDSNVVTDIGQATLNDFGAIYLSTNGFVCEATETCFLPSLVTGNLVTQVNGYAEAGSGVYTDENMAGLYAVGNVFAFLSHNAVYLHCGDNVSARRGARRFRVSAPVSSQLAAATVPFCARRQRGAGRRTHRPPSLPGPRAAHGREQHFVRRPRPRRGPGLALRVLQHGRREPAGRERVHGRAAQRPCRGGRRLDALRRRRALPRRQRLVRGQHVLRRAAALARRRSRLPPGQLAQLRAVAGGGPGRKRRRRRPAHREPAAGARRRRLAPRRGVARARARLPAARPLEGRPAALAVRAVVGWAEAGAAQHKQLRDLPCPRARASK